MSALAFVLNLDAEMELEARRYQPTRAVAARVRALAQAMRPALPKDAYVIDPLAETAPHDAEPIAWCPTPRALAAFAAAGRRAPEAPPVSVLARVNDRRFAASIDEDELEGRVVVTDLAQAREALQRPGDWLLKRCFGVSGRGQRPVRGADASAADEDFVRASLARHGALVIEPRLTIVRELSVHAWALPRGPRVRTLRAQTIDAHGAFVGSAPAQGLAASTCDALERAAERVGHALIAAGYLGPFGIDAIEHRGGLRAISEINARYCMGWDDADGWRAPD